MTKIKDIRKSLGLTQAQLATDAGVSLATLQNIEAGSANPSLSVLMNIFNVLGLDFSFKPQSANWAILTSMGVPLINTSEEKSEIRLDRLGLVIELKKACWEIIHRPDHRKAMALSSYLLVIKNHYDNFWKILEKSIPSINNYISVEINGNLIKLYRIALARIDYL